MRKFLLILIVLALAGAGGAYWWSGRGGVPVIAVAKPQALMGQGAVVEVTVGAPGGLLSKLDVTFEQGGKATTLFSLGQAAAASLTQDGPDRVRVTVPATRKEIVDLKSGDARVLVVAERQVLYGFRTLASSFAHPVRVRLELPRVAVLSMHHYINHGGSEFVVFRATPNDVTAGVRVGDRSYAAYPGSAVGIADPAVRVAVYALLHDQDLTTPMKVFATDEAEEASGAWIVHAPDANASLVQ